MDNRTSRKRILVTAAIFLLSLLSLSVWDLREIAAAPKAQPYLIPRQEDSSLAKEGGILLAARGARLNAQTAYQGASLTNGSGLVTSNDAAMLSLGNAGRLTLNPQSEMTLTRVGNEVNISLKRGAAHFWSEPGLETKLNVTLPNGNLTILYPQGGYSLLTAQQHDSRLSIISAEKALDSVQVTFPNGHTETITQGSQASLDLLNSDIKSLTSTNNTQDFELRDLFDFQVFAGAKPNLPLHTTATAGVPSVEADTDDGILLTPISPTRP
ncbi:MAG: hypothetical protein AB1489_23005 [Acidobacteriota bacterium]